jgi:glycosyltransferase involved in cell wall biosynthesis
MLPLQAHCFAFGGFEVQMLELYNSLSQTAEVEIVKMNPWDRSPDFDILHLWGLEQANFNNAYWAKKSGKKVVLTALIGQVHGITDHLRFKVSEKIGNVRFLKKVVDNIDALVVVNDLEASKAIHYFKMDENKVHIIPNIITRQVMDFGNLQVKSVSKFRNYFFCAGNISERKNQLSLAEISSELKINMAFAGDFICSEEYQNKFLAVVNGSESLEYHGVLSNVSNDLLGLFKHCDAFCLPSYQETQPISVLEAAFFKKNILIGNGSYANQRLFKNLIKVDPKSKKSLKSGLLELKSAEQEQYTIPANDLKQCYFNTVADNYLNLYRSI